MKHSMIRLAMSAASFLVLTIPPAVADVPAGGQDGNTAYPTEYWTNDKDGWSVKTAACGDAMCAYLVDFKVKPDEPPGYQPVDRHNPDAKRRQDKMCGLQMMGGFHQSTSTGATWDGGWVYDPDSGTRYSGKITIIDKDTVKLRGFIGISLLGRTLELHRRAVLTTSCTT